MRRFPQRPDLLCLPPWRKDLLLDTQLKHVLQMFCFGVVAAGLPLTDGAAGDPQQGAYKYRFLPQGASMFSRPAFLSFATFFFP